MPQARLPAVQLRGDDPPRRRLGRRSPRREGLIARPAGRLLAAATALAIAGCGKGYRLRKLVPAGPPAPVPAAAAPADPRPAGAAKPADPELRVTVRGGETMAAVAERELGHRLLWRHLMEWNKRSEGPRDPLPDGTTLAYRGSFRGLVGPPAPPRPAPPPAPRTPATVRTPPIGEGIFEPGEVLSYLVKWFVVTAGRATMRVEGLDEADGVRTYRLRADAKSRILFFFKVEDWITSVSLAGSLLPLRFEKHLREGRYSKDLVATFDRDTLTATWGGRAAPFGAECRDLLGAFYHFRTLDLPPPGKRLSVCVHTDRKNYELVVEVVGRQRVTTPAGAFDTVVIKPKLKFEGLFRQRGDLLIWLSDDRRRIPVLVRAKVVLLGSVNIVLTDIGARGG